MFVRRTVPPFYGFPKVHKPGVLLRPIVSFVSSPTYAFSKFLAKVSSPLVGKTESFVASSSDFVNYTKTLRIPQGYTLLSFDVMSFFTKVPTDLAVEVIGRRLESNDILEEVDLPAEAIISLLQFCLTSTYYRYGDEFYEQIHGTAMGSPVSVAVANIVMEEVERQALVSSLIHCMFWKRYVDNVLCAIPEDGTEDMLAHINSQSTAISSSHMRRSQFVHFLPGYQDHS